MSPRCNKVIFGAIMLTCGAVALSGLGATVSLASPVMSGQSSPATIRVFTAPVTASGHAVSGFTVMAEPDDTVSCSPANASPVAISPNVEECSPSAAYAVACWKSATAHRALCLLDPRSHKLTSAKLMGPFAATPPISAAQRAPFAIVLADGTVCSIRDGGAWGSLQGHPNLFGSYSCDHHGVVWVKNNGKHYGVNETTPAWTVRTAPAGNHQLVTRHVARAYFVATAAN